MVMVGYRHQGEEAEIYVAYFKIFCAMGEERRVMCLIFILFIFKHAYYTEFVGKAWRYDGVYGTSGQRLGFFNDKTPYISLISG